MPEPTWSSRIPAAIAKAEGLVAAASPQPWWDESGVIHSPLPNGGAQHPVAANYDIQMGDWRANGQLASLGPDAVALAKALWERCNHIGPLSREAAGNNWVEACACGYSHDFDFDCEAVVLAPPPDALRAFCEKVEGL